MLRVGPNAAGGFTQPVCVIYDLDFGPTVFSTENRPATNGVLCLLYAAECGSVWEEV